MTTVEFIDHLTTIFFDLIMPAIGLWIVYVLRQLLAAWLPHVQLVTRGTGDGVVGSDGRRHP